jgi:hypothetical protein
VLGILVVLNLLASGAHFAHNALFLDTYPGPLWIPGPWFVVGAWCLVAALLIRGYTWHRQGKATHALVAISTYCASCFLVFGHYLYGPPRAHAMSANVFIVLEGAAAMVLLFYYVMWAPGPPGAAA